MDAEPNMVSGPLRGWTPFGVWNDSLVGSGYALLGFSGRKGAGERETEGEEEAERTGMGEGIKFVYLLILKSLYQPHKGAGSSEPIRGAGGPFVPTSPLLLIMLVAIEHSLQPTDPWRQRWTFVPLPPGGWGEWWIQVM